MSGIETTLTGADRLASSLQAAGALLVDLDPVNTEAGAVVLDAARIPVRTGALLASAHVIGAADGVTVVAGGPAAPYAPAVHARDPFLTDALAARAEDVAALYFDHAARAVETIQGA